MLLTLFLAGGLPVSLAIPSQSFGALTPFDTHLAPPSTQRVANAPQDHTFTLTIALTQPRIDELSQVAYALADPRNARYGKHLTKEQADAYAAPDPTSVEAVRQWLQSHALEGQWSATSDSVAIPDVAVAKAEQMLDTTYSVFKTQDGSQIVRTESYKLPQNLHQHIDFVHPTNVFSNLRRQASTRINRESAKYRRAQRPQKRDDTGSACDNPGDVSITCIRQLYNTYDYTPQATDSNLIATTGYLQQYASLNDLGEFMQDQRPDQADFRFKVVSVAGGRNPQGSAGTEADLDVETVAGITAPTPNIFYTTPMADGDDDFLTWANFALSQDDASLPKVVSTSYGDDEQSVSRSFATRLCNAYMQLGTRGVSILFSSGDSGVGGQSACRDNTGRASFVPGFPNGCPFITSVGATENFSPEQAVGYYGGYYGGGGFSNYFAAPDYQTSDTQDYISLLGGQYSGMYNQTGRGFPDVSAQGAQFEIYLNGRWTHVGGTSASCPTFSSVIALLNDYRLSQGQPVLGFLNPWLYSSGRKGLNDVTQGSNAGCDTDGFPATTGWDAATGLGTPDFKKLQDVLP